MTGVRLNRMHISPRARRRLATDAVLVGLLLEWLLLGSMVLGSMAPARAVERVVAITADARFPRDLTISLDDMVVLVNQDAPLRYGATSTSGNWSFESTLAVPLLVLVPTPAGPSSRAAGPPQVSANARLVVAGDLPGPGSPRGLGLPAVLAAVLVLGVASLLVRVLLAEPTPRRRAADTS